MASVSMANPLTSATTQKRQSCESFLKPLPVRRPSKKALFGKSNSKKAKLQVVDASLKEKAVAGITAAAMTASILIPEAAEAAGSGVSPSLQNFLLSIAAGGVVLVAIIGAVVGVSNFDPVKRS